MQEINRRIGERIREAREAKGLTQKELGEYLGYSPMGISYFERGEREVKFSDLERLSGYFGKDPSYFLSAGLTIFRGEKVGVDENVAKSVDAFNKFLSKREESKEK
jgi:HTH-type transcriptional regulator / antitoxin HipB